MSNHNHKEQPLGLPGLLTSLLLLLTLPAGLAQALPDDQDQPIHITADKALRDEKLGFTVYSGNVQMDQGSMRLEADKLTIYHVNEDADKIVAEGQPAKMQQQPELDKGTVYAQAGVIEYFKNEDRVHLQTDARIEQDGSLVAGDSIDYFIEEQLVKADSDTADESKRVQVVIPPSVPAPATIPDPNAGQPATAGEISAQATATTIPEQQPAAGDSLQEEVTSGTTDSE